MKVITELMIRKTTLQHSKAESNSAAYHNTYDYRHSGVSSLNVSSEYFQYNMLWENYFWAWLVD